MSDTSRPSLALDVIRPIATTWVASARATFDPANPLVRAALETNFAWRATPPKDQASMVALIAAHFASIADVLARAERIFRSPSRHEVRRHFGANVPPAYAFEGYVWFPEAFRETDDSGGFGPKCLAAMVIHESVHVFDARSGEPAIHISEWDEPTFSAIPPLLQIHNPSAYASYAAQVHHGALEWPRDIRFGAGRPRD